MKNNPKVNKQGRPIRSGDDASHHHGSINPPPLFIVLVAKDIDPHPSSLSCERVVNSLPYGASNKHHFLQFTSVTDRRQPTTFSPRVKMDQDRMAKNNEI